MGTHHWPPGQAETSPATHRLLAAANYFLRDRNFSDCRNYALRARDSDTTHPAPTAILAVATVLSAPAISPSRHDYYAVLSLPHFEPNDFRIRDSFRTLASNLNPRVNSYPFADEALRLILTAWSVLSNPEERARFDEELRTSLSASDGGSRHDNCTSGNDAGTFWTICPYCYYMYEFEGVYMECCVRCSNEKCRKVMHAVPISGPPPPPDVVEKGQYLCTASDGGSRHGNSTTENDADTFWTICPYCYYVYEFEGVYKECCVRCSNEKCRRVMHAVPISGPPPPPDVVEKGQYLCTASDGGSRLGNCTSGNDAGTFWTICPYCYYVYEFEGVYKECCVRCSNEKCRRVMHAVAIGGPPPPPDVVEKGQYLCTGFVPLGFSGGGGGGKVVEKLWAPFEARAVGSSSKMGDQNAASNGEGAVINVYDEEMVRTEGVGTVGKEFMDLNHGEREKFENGEMKDLNGERFMSGNEIGFMESGVKEGRTRRKKSVLWNSKKLMGRGVGIDENQANLIYGSGETGDSNVVENSEEELELGVEGEVSNDVVIASGVGLFEGDDDVLLGLQCDFDLSDKERELSNV
ncbi:Chaperone DnaJ-domain superfamily protein [Striga hermonthica]|uniref:Chaperone DnaJ-domain superfamily protein n=1 Tax=Striga hermonthica TaxID=68872 RepID=A0A9N7N400_STRHE|nr:Chaperone DnaJ-domain superfamily protein [Striga hermonthica]